MGWCLILRNMLRFIRHVFTIFCVCIDTLVSHDSCDPLYHWAVITFHCIYLYSYPCSACMSLFSSMNMSVLCVYFQVHDRQAGGAVTLYTCNLEAHSLSLFWFHSHPNWVFFCSFQFPGEKNGSVLKNAVTTFLQNLNNSPLVKISPSHSDKP